MTITLNGDPHELPAPLSVSALLEQLEIDARRVAVELNLAVVKKAAYDSSVDQGRRRSRDRQLRRGRVSDFGSLISDR